MRIFDVDTYGTPPTSDGKWQCLQCGGAHPVWFHIGELMLCPTMHDKAAADAREYIEKRLARARGQYLDIELAMLNDLADEIVGWEGHYPSWAPDVRREYLSHPRLGEILKKAMRDPLDDLPPGHNSQLNTEDSKLIVDYLPLVRSYALARVTKIHVFDAGTNAINLNGETSIDQVQFADLEDLGIRILEEEMRRFDPTRGVTFGAFVKKRLAGAMDNWLTRERVKTAPSAAVATAKWWAEANDDAPKAHRDSTGAYREQSYVSKAERPVQRPNGVSWARLRPARGNAVTMGTAIQRALARLNDSQRVVYQDRVLAEPQVPRTEVARKLGIHEVNIPRIEKQAHKRIAKYLAEN